MISYATRTKPFSVACTERSAHIGQAALARRPPRRRLLRGEAHGDGDTCCSRVLLSPPPPMDRLGLAHAATVRLRTTPSPPRAPSHSRTTLLSARPPHPPSASTRRAGRPLLWARSSFALGARRCMETGHVRSIRLWRGGATSPGAGRRLLMDRPGPEEVPELGLLEGGGEIVGRGPAIARGRMLQLNVKPPTWCECRQPRDPGLLHPPNIQWSSHDCPSLLQDNMLGVCMSKMAHSKSGTRPCAPSPQCVVVARSAAPKMPKEG